MRSEFHIIRNDLTLHKKTILSFTLILQAAYIMAERGNASAMGIATGLSFSAVFGFSRFCLSEERMRRTLDLLLSLPMRPRNVILAKIGSIYSMSLFLVNAPGIYEISLGHFRTVLFANAIVLLGSTVCLVPAVLFDKPWAPLAPLWAVFIVLALPEDFRLPAYNLLMTHPVPFALAAIIVSPVMAVLSAIIFEKTT